MSAASFLVVPQWQGSGSARAMRLIDGAEAIRGDLPTSATHVVPVPSAAGEALGTGVHRYSSLTLVRERATAELALLGSPVVTVGGDGAADLASAQHAVSARGGDVAVVWFDAHGDLNDVSSSPSGAFHGMVLRALLGDGPDGLASTGEARLEASKLLLAGTRSLDDGESAFVERAGIRVLAPDELDEPDSLVRAVEATGATAVYVHVDLDVLDPAHIDGIGYPVPFGLTPSALCDTIRALRARFELAGAAVTEFAPATPEAASHDLPVILRVLGALTGPVPEGAPASPERRPRHVSTDPGLLDDGLGVGG